jgi:hypothetical protein
MIAMANDPNKNAGAAHVQINQDYYDMPPEEQRDFLRNLLMGISPNENVRKQAKKTSD